MVATLITCIHTIACNRALMRHRKADARLQWLAQVEDEKAWSRHDVSLEKSGRMCAGWISLVKKCLAHHQADHDENENRIQVAIIVEKMHQ